MSLYSPIFPSPLAKTPNTAPAQPLPHYETWYWKLNDPKTGNALWLRLSTLATENGFQQVSEAWAIFFESKPQSGEVKRTGLKQTFDLRERKVQGSPSGDQQISVGPCLLSDSHTRGKIESKGNTIEWDLKVRRGALDQFERKKIQPPLPDLQSPQFNLIPARLRKLVPSHAFTVSEDLIYEGTCNVNGQIFVFESAHGMLGHHGGKRMGHSWLWGHASDLVDEKGNPVPILTEALRAKSRLPLGLVSPEISSVYLLLKDQEFTWNRLRDQSRIRSENTLTQWNIMIDQGHLRVRLQWQAEHSWFAGVTYVDTNGAQAYCANTKVADFVLHWYWKGKLEGSAFGKRNSAFERVTRTRPEYVPILIE